MSRNKYNKICDKMREKIMFMHSSKNYSVSKISETLEIKKSTIYTILKNFQKKGSILLKKRGGNRRGKLDSEQKKFILTIVGDCPSLSLNEISKIFQEKYNFPVSKSTINRVLLNMNYSLKRLTLVPIVRNSETTKLKRKEYEREFSNLLAENSFESFVFLDEVGFSVT
ncbi:hypothetical protein DMUE_2835 [Dictyocoela muelleri]|nr:hypothetical protein DMUE_2835 [Dictyocoela muelleri]